MYVGIILDEVPLPTMVDVARHAKVAVSTVSYAINGTRHISDETRRRIFTVMQELGYKPNVMARGLATKRSRIIALLFPTPERGLGITELEFVTSAVDAASERGYHLVLWTSEMKDPNELKGLVQQGLVDGVVVMEIHLNDQRIELLRHLGIPFSMIGRCAENNALSYTDVDFEQTLCDAVTYLRNLGHTHIAFMNHSQVEMDAGYGPVVRAQAGFEKAIHDANLNGISRFCRAAPQYGYDVFNKLLKENPRLTALVTMNERAVPGVMRAITEKKWRIPDDFSIVVILSSARVAEVTIPALTTFDAPCTALGRLGVDLLIKKIEEQKVDQGQSLLPCQLVVRGSSGPCRRMIG